MRRVAIARYDSRDSIAHSRWGEETQAVSQISRSSSPVSNPARLSLFYATYRLAIHRGGGAAQVGVGVVFAALVQGGKDGELALDLALVAQANRLVAIYR